MCKRSVCLATVGWPVFWLVLETVLEPVAVDIAWGTFWNHFTFPGDYTVIVSQISKNIRVQRFVLNGMRNESEMCKRSVIWSSYFLGIARDCQQNAHGRHWLKQLTRTFGQWASEKFRELLNQIIYEELALTSGQFHGIVILAIQHWETEDNGFLQNRPYSRTSRQRPPMLDKTLDTKIVSI